MTYAEFLRSQGASEEDVKALDTSIGRKAFEASQASTAAAIAERDAAKAGAVAYEERANAWFTEQNKKYGDLQKQVVITSGGEARARAALMKAQELGLIDVAKDLGYTPEAPVVPPDPKLGTPGFDPNQYFTREDILKIAQSEGDAIAVAQNIAFEHTRLFPDKTLDFVALRARALAAKKPVQQV